MIGLRSPPWCSVRPRKDCRHQEHKVRPHQQHELLPVIEGKQSAPPAKGSRQQHHEVPTERHRLRERECHHPSTISPEGIRALASANCRPNAATRGVASHHCANPSAAEPRALVPKLQAWEAYKAPGPGQRSPATRNQVCRSSWLSES